MAAIVTVHGTFATGPDTGTDWWQIGSEFERDLSRYVDSEEGQLCFIPNSWSGENSEVSRRVAGLSLANRLKEFELKGEKYCLVGHSHGGSVIAAALVACASSRFAFRDLSRWITVGTPFLSSKKRFFLFSRLGLFAKALYLTLFSGAVFLTFLVILQRPDLAWHTESTAYVTYFMAAQLAFLAFLPLGIAHAGLLFFDWRRTRWYAASDARLAVPVDRWFSLRHPADEAIGGLRATTHLNLQLVGKKFIVEPLTSAAALMSPILVIGLVWMFFLPQYAFDPQGYPLDVFASKFIEFLRVPFDLKYIPAYILLFLTAFPVMLFLASVMAILAIRYVALGISGFASRLLNQLVWREVQKKSFGDDTLDAMAVGADYHPVWAQSAQPSLPQELILQLDSEAARASTASMLKFRAAIQQSLFQGADFQSRAIAEYLTWDELIHTSYFKASSFRKLIAFVISRSPGFRASKQLVSDPDYPMMIRWYESTHSRPG